MATVNVTVGMTPEMLDTVDEQAEKHDMSRARYIREAVREAESTPFECDMTLEELADDEANEQMGAA